MEMSKDKKSTITVQGAAITILSQREEDFISLTDMVKKIGDDSLIYSWMRNRNTLEFLGIWEQIHNPDFKGGEFETFKKEEGNMREYARVEQLLVLAERYATPLPKLLDEVESLSSRVDEHLGKMGFVWK